MVSGMLRELEGGGGQLLELVLAPPSQVTANNSTDRGHTILPGIYRQFDRASWMSAENHKKADTRASLDVRLAPT